MKALNRFALMGLLAFVAAPYLPARTARAADHGDAPNVDNDPAADIGDVFLFLDPDDNTKVVLIGTFHGFIVPGEAGNFAAFDPNVQYRFDLEQTGDAKPDASITVTFAERTAAGTAQTATITLPGKGKKAPSFTAPTTPPTLAATANPQTVTTDPTSGVAFFAGEVDDPFFFDATGFGRFVASVKAGTPDATTLQRGRDTFAGYNTLAIALRLPVDLVRGASDNTKLGVQFVTSRRTQTSNTKTGDIVSKGKFKQLDRAGVPAVNTALIPFAKKNLYNVSTPVDDANNKFAPDIIASLHAFGTNDTNIGVLASVAVTNGDYLRLDLTKPNTGAKGGVNPEAAFPNGRRLADDVIDTLLTIINNGTPLGDNVNASDVPPQDHFPFLALPQQPQAAGVVDDNTRN